MTAFEHILQPFQIKNTEFPNRIFVSAHSYGYADSNGLPTDELFHYVLERAKGGSGLVIMGATAVSQEGYLGNSYSLNDSDQIVPIYQRIADSAHEYGTRIFDQFLHAGGQPRYDGVSRAYAPSAVSHARNITVPIELTIDHIKRIVQEYVDAAHRAYIGHLDGVEITGAQGFLVHQFLSPKFNRRQDSYGGDADRRMRFLLELLEAIRANVPSEFVLGYRLNADSFEDDDTTVDDAKRVVSALEQRRLIDYVSVTAALNGSYVGYWLGHGEMSVPTTTFADLSAAIRENTGLPIMLTGKIKHASQAEYIVERGIADMVGMTRAHIADPEIVNKIRAGRTDDIRPCISCNQGCVGGVWGGTGAKCIFNPATGREKHLGIGTLAQAHPKKKVLVVGGGVAGMEFARVAALRGHHVSLYDAKGALGGQLLLASVAPYRNEFQDAVSYMANQITKLGVEIHLGEEVTAQKLLDQDSDVVVLATGARDRIPLVDCEDDSKIATGSQVLEGKPLVGKNILVVDGDWKQNALSIAEFLMNQGKNVEVITSRAFIGEGLNITSIVSFSSRLLQKGAKLTPLLELVAVQRDHIVLRHTLTGEKQFRSDIDHVVFVIGPQPNNELYDAIKGRLPNVKRIGDCDYPRGVQNAIYDAHIIARTI